MVFIYFFNAVIKYIILQEHSNKILIKGKHDTCLLNWLAEEEYVLMVCPGKHRCTSPKIK